MSKFQIKFSEIINLINIGNFKAAKAKCELLKNKASNNPIVFNLLGIIYKNLNELNKAKFAFLKAIQINPQFAEPLCNLGDVYIALGEYDESINFSKKALLIKPNFIEALNNLGLANKNKKNLKVSLEYFDKAIKLSPKNFLLYNNKGSVLSLIKDYTEAAKNFELAIKLNPKFIWSHINLGNIYYEINKINKALKVFQELKLISPNQPEIYNYEGRCYISLGKINEAKNSFLHSIKINPNYAEAIYNLSLVCKLEEGDELFKKTNLLERDNKLSKRDLIFVRFALGNFYEKISNYQKSFHQFSKANSLKKSLNNNLVYHETDEVFQIIKSDFIKTKFFNHKKESKSNKTPIFILGMPRSGTSLIEQIISNHSSVFGCGELEFVNEYIQTFIKQKTPTIIFKSQDSRSLRNYYFKKIDKINFNEKFFTDKMPMNFRWVGYILSSIPDAKIIHIQRDKIANCWSLYKRNFFSSGNSYTYDLKDLVHFYKLYLDLMSFWDNKFKNKIYKINYERFVENSEDEIKNLLKFCGLDFEKECLEFYNSKRSVNTASSLQVRKKIYLNASEEWKNYREHLDILVKGLNG